jgi:hypothetical protein
MKEACFTKPLTIAFTEEIYLKIKELTDRKKISMGEWVRLAAAREIDNDEYFQCREGGNKS